MIYIYYLPSPNFIGCAVIVVSTKSLINQNIILHLFNVMLCGICWLLQFNWHPKSYIRITGTICSSESHFNSSKRKLKNNFMSFWKMFPWHFCFFRNKQKDLYWRKTTMDPGWIQTQDCCSYLGEILSQLDNVIALKLPFHRISPLPPTNDLLSWGLTVKVYLPKTPQATGAILLVFYISTWYQMNVLWYSCRY